jgi:hypothetical protein
LGCVGQGFVLGLFFAACVFRKPYATHVNLLPMGASKSTAKRLRLGLL